MKEVKVERRGYGFELENPICVENNLALYKLLQGFRLDKDMDGNVVLQSVLQNILPIEEKSSDKIKCFRFYFPVDLEKTELYDLYFCVDPNISSGKDLLDTKIPEGLKLKVSEEETILSQSAIGRYKTKQQHEEDRLKYQEYLDGIKREVDELLPKALAFFIEEGTASAILLRRKFNIGYPKAALLIDKMEQSGYISSPQGQTNREVFITKEEFKRLFGNN